MSKNTTPDLFSWVREFNTTGKQTVRDTPQLFIPPIERRLRFDLVAEEIDELIEKGFKALDIVELADGLADIVYVAVGAGLSHGFSFDIRRETSDFRLSLTEDRLMRDAYSECMRMLTLELFSASSAPDTGNVKDEANNINRMLRTLQAIVATCYQIASSYGIDLDAVLTEVQASNMSKFGPNKEVYQNEKGKTIKGPNYFKADIPRVLRENGLDIATVGGWNPDAASLDAWPHYNGTPLGYLATVNKDSAVYHVFLDGTSTHESWRAEGDANCVIIQGGNYPEWITASPVDEPVLAKEGMVEMVNVPVTSEPEWIQGDQTPMQADGKTPMNFVAQIPSQFNGETLVNIGDAYGTLYVFSDSENTTARALWQS